jgi:tetratricopeptide (TPR) repeat protein
MASGNYGDGTAWPDEHIAALLKRAVELSPNNASATKYYAQYATSDDEVLVLYQRAAQLDPRSGIIRHNIAERYLDRGQNELALEWFLQSARATEPYFAPALLIPTCRRVTPSPDRARSALHCVAILIALRMTPGIRSPHGSSQRW